MLKNVIKLWRQILQLAEIETDKAKLIVESELAEGVEVFVEKDGEIVPAEDGEYEAEDKIIVVAEGKVAEIRVKEEEAPAEEEQPAEEEPKEEEEAPAEEPAQEEAEDKDARIAELEARVAELEAMLAEKDAKIAELVAEIEKKDEELKMSADEPKTVVGNENESATLKPNFTWRQ